MEKVKILVIAPYEGLASIISKVAEDKKDIDITVKVGDLDAAVRVVKNLPWNQYDALISRGGTAELLKHHINLPIVEIPVSVYDVLRALKTAELYTTKVAVVGYANITECSSQLKNILQFSMDLYTINEFSDLNVLMQELKDKGYDLFLCDMISYQHARQAGLNALLITSGEETVLTALDECVRITRAYKTTKVQRDLLRYFLTGECQEAFVYSLEGDLEFSTMVQSTKNAHIFNAIQNNIDKYRGVPFVFDKITSEDLTLTLQGHHVHTDGQTHVVLYLTYDNASASTSRQVISLLDGSPIGKKSMNNTFRQLLDTIYPREIMEMLDGFADSTFPVLISGEKGCGTDTIAQYIFEKATNRTDSFITFNCEQIKEKNWNYLLNNSNSALLHSSITLFFENVDHAQLNQMIKLIDFMEQSGFKKYNRVIFSSAPQSKEAESESYAYIRERCSCCYLALPPLNANKDRIPAILTMYENDLEMETGKQIIGFSPQAMRMLQKFDWKQNYAQLLRVARSLFAATATAYIDVQAVRLALEMENSERTQTKADALQPINTRQSMDKINYDIIRCVLNEEMGNQSKAAKRLDISRTTLWRILKNNA